MIGICKHPMFGGIFVDIKKPVRMSLSAQVLSEIEKLIKNGVWKVGEKIPAEPELVEQFGVSRNTLREAIQSLIHAGILEAKQGDGTYILTNSRLDAIIAKKLKSTDIIEILEVRSLIEKELAKKACQKASQEQIEELFKCLDRRNQVYEDQSEAVKVDMEFHLYIANIAGNTLLYDLYKSMYGHISNLIGIYFQETNYHKQDELHNGLYEAIKNRDEEKAIYVISTLIEMEEKILAGKSAGTEALRI
jgi:DNA-binding FadR family transcriptional regulator